MSTESALFQAILDDPDATDRRLVYADWLEDHGDAVRLARAEFIRVQCQLEVTPPADPRFAVLLHREQQLLAEHRRRWNGPLHERLHRAGLVRRVAIRRGGIRRWAYRRGFVEALWLQAEVFLEHTELLFGL